MTFNLKDFPTQALERYAVRALSPDDFILDIIDLEPDAVYDSAQTTWRRLKNPPLTWDNYLRNLRRCGLDKTAEWLSKR